MSPTKSLPDRTEAIYRELRSMRRHFQIGSWITLIVGGLLLALVSFYFCYGYSEISDFKDPELLVSLVGQTIDQQIPIIRQRIESEVNANAETWAKQASDKVLEAIPSLRDQIEQLALQQSDTIIEKIDVVGEKQFRRIIEENRPIMEQAIRDVKGGEDVSEEVLLALQLAIEKELQIEGSNQAAVVLTIASDLNRNMEQLLAGKDLSAEQKAERRVLMLAKRFQKERFGDVTLDRLTLPKVVDDIVRDREQTRMNKETSKEAAEADDAPAEKKPAAEKKPVEPAKPAVKPAEKKPAPAAKKEPAKAAPKPAEKKPEPAAEKKPAEEKPAEEKPAEKKPAEEKPAEK